MKRLLLLALAAAPAFSQTAAPAAAPAPKPTDTSADAEPFFSGSLDLGYRWLTGVGGNFNTWRSIVNLGSGPKLLGADFTLIDPKHRYFDVLNVRAANWGDDPYSTFHLDAKKSRLYDFSADYRNIAYFNNLPSYADPVAGSLFSWQSLDTHQRLASFHLDLLPDHRFVPYLAYERDSDTGTGVATFVSGDNEFAVASRTRNSTSNYRGGLRMELSRWRLTLEQGGTTFKDDQQLSQNPGQVNPGDSTAKVFGQTLDLTSLLEAYGVRGHAVYSKALITANINSWFDLYGQFLFSQPSSSVNFRQFDTGNQVVLSQLLFYTGEQSIVSAQSKLPHASGSVGAEIRPLLHLRVLPSWLTDRMHTSGSDQTQQALTTAASKTLSTSALLSSGIVTNYSQGEISLIFDAAPTLTLHGGYRYAWGDASDFILPVAELTAYEHGSLRRHVALGGFSWRPLPNLSFVTDFESGSSNGNYFRTSLYNYQKARFRMRYRLTPSLTLSAAAALLDNRNPALNYTFRSRQESLSLLYLPAHGKLWDVQGTYSRGALYSNIDYLDPAYLAPEASRYRDNSHTATAVVNANLPLGGITARLSAGGSLFISSGSNPTKFFQPLGKLSVPFSRHVAWVTEWRYYGFGEVFYTTQSFRAQTVVTGFHFTP
jgi:hypothetical protein